MNILFIGSVCPKDREAEIKSSSSYFDYPGNTLQWALLSGFDKFAKVRVVSSLRIISEISKLPGSAFSHADDCKDICIETYSSLLKRKLYNGRNIAKAAITSDFEPDIIFVYSYSFELLKATAKIKRAYPKAKVLLMVTDLAEYMTENAGIKSLLKSVETIICKKYLKKYVDGFVLLSKYMKEQLPISDGNYTVVEGIFDKKENLPCMDKVGGKVFLYTGNLGKRYGIMDMVNAFCKIKGDEYKLWICGKGDSETEIIEIQKKDSRVKFFGVVDRNQALMLQRQATVLVNPRHSAEEYTKYSFPSKTMEYMASGTPTLMAPLASLPEEYRHHLYLFDDESVDGMSRKMKEVSDKTDRELYVFGLNASQFILDTRNQVAQCNKIIEFYMSLK